MSNLYRLHFGPQAILDEVEARENPSGLAAKDVVQPPREADLPQQL